MDNYVTFLAGIIRSVRFGASEAHGIANMVCFNFFEEEQAFSRDADGRFRVDFDKTREGDERALEDAADDPGRRRLRRREKLTAEQGKIGTALAADSASCNREHPGRRRLRAGAAVLGLAQ